MTRTIVSRRIDQKRIRILDPIACFGKRILTDPRRASAGLVFRNRTIDLGQQQVVVAMVQIRQTDRPNFHRGWLPVVWRRTTHAECWASANVSSLADDTSREVRFVASRGSSLRVALRLPAEGER